MGARYASSKWCFAVNQQMLGWRQIRSLFGESATPDDATWGRKEVDLFRALKDDKVPTLVDARNRHGC